MLGAECAVFTVRFAKPGDEVFSLEEKRLCAHEAQRGLTGVLSEITQGSGLTVELSYAGEGEGTFGWSSSCSSGPPSDTPGELAMPARPSELL